MSFYREFYSFKELLRNYNNPSIQKVFFFSEGSHHYYHLEPFIKFFCQKFQVIYISLESEDIAKKIKKKNFIFIKLSSLFFLNLLFKLIKNSIFFTSLPDLRKMYFKNYLQNNNKFFYVFHSLASAHIQYNKDAFKEFDGFFCSGPHHYFELNKMKKIYNLKFKMLIKYGYPRIENLRKIKKHVLKNQILIASTWGINSITNKIADQLIGNLLKTTEYNIVFRPHFNSVKQDYKLIKKINEKYKYHKNFMIDFSNSSTLNLLTSKLLITDWGATFSDFYLGLNKPVIFINLEMKKNNLDYKKISPNSFERNVRNKIGNIVDLKNVKNIKRYINNALKEKLEDKKIKNITNKYVYNFLKSEKVLNKELVSFEKEFFL